MFLQWPYFTNIHASPFQFNPEQVAAKENVGRKACSEETASDGKTTEKTKCRGEGKY